MSSELTGCILADAMGFVMPIFNARILGVSYLPKAA